MKVGQNQWFQKVPEETRMHVQNFMSGSPIPQDISEDVKRQLWLIGLVLGEQGLRSLYTSQQVLSGERGQISPGDGPGAAEDNRQEG